MGFKPQAQSHQLAIQISVVCDGHVLPSTEVRRVFHQGLFFPKAVNNFLCFPRVVFPVQNTDLIYHEAIFKSVTSIPMKSHEHFCSHYIW